MNVYNSAGGLYQDDTDMTMINHSFLYGGIDEPISSCIPIVRRVQQANQSKSVSRMEERNDGLEHVRQIEEILKFYRQDLKQESNSQLDCNRQLLTRLTDFIRPSYSTDENRMKDLDILYNEILQFQENRFTEQKEKNDQLYHEIRYLKTSIMAKPIENEDREKKHSHESLDKIGDDEQWMEIEEETRELHNIIKSQNEKIEQLFELLSPTVEERSDEPNKHSQFELPVLATEIQIIDHCVNPAAPEIPPENERFLCPYCNEQVQNQDEIAYIEHLSQCFNEMNGTF